MESQRLPVLCPLLLAVSGVGWASAEQRLSRPVVCACLRRWRRDLRMGRAGEERGGSLPVSAPDADVLRGRCSQKAADLGPEGVRGHTVGFPVTAWDEPDGVPRAGCISRGDVLDIGQQVGTRARPASDLLAASFIWGWAPPATAPAASATSALRPGTGSSPHCSVPWTR